MLMDISTAPYPTRWVNKIKSKTNKQTKLTIKTYITIFVNIHAYVKKHLWFFSKCINTHMNTWTHMNIHTDTHTCSLSDAHTRPHIPVVTQTHIYMASYYTADTHIRSHTPVAMRTHTHTHTHTHSLILPCWDTWRSHARTPVAKHMYTHTHAASYYHAETHEGLTLALLWPNTCIHIYTQPHTPLVTHTQGLTFL